MKTRLVGVALVIGTAVVLWSWRVTQYPAAVTPTLLQLSTFGVVPGGQWASLGASTPLMYFALPLRAPEKGVQLILNAPHPSTLTMSAIDPAPPTAFGLAQISAGDPEPSTGFFRVDSVDTASRPPRWFVTVGPPATFISQPVSRFIIGVTNVSHNPFTSGTSRTSSPLIVTLDTRPDFTVTVAIDGPGRVSSTPQGISCGSDCQFGFGRYPVTLNPNSTDPQNYRFVGWSGNCSGTTCVLDLTGTAAFVVAHFRPFGQTITVCPQAPLIMGWTWRETPMCSARTFNTPVQCDAQGYFCCDPGGANPRCVGNDKTLTPPDCGINTEAGKRLRLFQPGGCYEATSR